MLGRERDADIVGEMLDQHRIVTLVGAGGIGKTTLALATSDNVRDRYDGGAFLVELAGVTDDDDLNQALARQLGHDSVEAFKIGTSGLATLVVLDNCETALTVARSIARELTESDDTVSVLATSRVPLGLHSERVHGLEPLGLPEQPGLDGIRDSPAVQLFLERAQQAGATWETTDVQLDAAAEIVRQLDGMPLAIELAAARARVVGPTDLVELLDEQLDVLNRPSDDRPVRHHSIRGAIYASYDPLATEVKHLFRRLSLVRSEVDLNFIHRLTGQPNKLDSLDLLTELVDQSLVVAREHEGTTGYRLLEPIRAYGLEQLDVMGETASAEESFIAAATAFADETIAAAMVSMSSEVIDRIEQRALILLAAIDATLRLDDAPDRAYRLYLLFYSPTSIPRSELNRMAAEVLARWPEHRAPLRAEALAVMAHSAMWAGDEENAIGRADIVLADPDATPLARLIAFRVHGFTAGHQGDRVAAAAHLEAAIGEAEALGGSFIREVRTSWASLLPAPERSLEALAVLDEAAAEAALHDEYLIMAWAASAAAHHQLVLGDFEAARRSAERSAELATRTDAPWATCAAFRTRASVSACDNGWKSSVSDWSDALEAEVMIGDIEGISLTIRTAASAAEYGEEHEIAGELWLSVPPRRGVSALPPIFDAAEDRLRKRYDMPIAVSVPEAVRKARALLRGGAEHPPAASPALKPRADHAPDAPIIRFDGYEIDLAAHELRRQGDRVGIEPQVFDVLVYLASNPGRMIPREELLDEVWGDRFVSPSALTSRIKSARAATGDDGKRQAVIRTVHGRGFMFVADQD